MHILSDQEKYRFAHLRHSGKASWKVRYHPNMELKRPDESQQRNLMKLSPRLVATNPVNGMVVINVPQQFYNFASQLLNTLGKRSDYFATCITCKHWKDTCTLYNAMPPPEVIANGCDNYQDRDYIPF